MTKFFCLISAFIGFVMGYLFSEIPQGETAVSEDIPLSSIFVPELNEETRNKRIVFPDTIGYLDIPMGLSFPVPEAEMEKFRQAIASNDHSFKSSYPVEFVWECLFYQTMFYTNTQYEKDAYKIPYVYLWGDNLPLSNENFVGLQKLSLNVISQNCDFVWPTPNVKWGDMLRLEYLEFYIERLKQYNHTDWVRIVKMLENERYYSLALDEIRYLATLIEEAYKNNNLTINAKMWVKLKEIHKSFSSGLRYLSPKGNIILPGEIEVHQIWIKTLQNKEKKGKE
ncbi:MAG: hypothetical protein LBF76_00670 [Holosporales bacterium]|jgi:hypothetical protein|nr:hypothetical protein [Holosporales bacterium]